MDDIALHEVIKTLQAENEALQIKYDTLKEKADEFIYYEGDDCTDSERAAYNECTVPAFIGMRKELIQSQAENARLKGDWERLKGVQDCGHPYLVEGCGEGDSVICRMCEQVEHARTFCALCARDMQEAKEAYERGSERNGR